jgi:hypothetical protein
MNVKLLASSALIVQSGILLVVYQLFRNYPIISQLKSAVHKRAASGGTSKNCELNSAFEKADRLLEPRATGSQYDKNAQLTLLNQHKLAFTGRNM